MANLSNTTLGAILKDLFAMALLFGLACISAFVFHTDGKILFGAGIGILALARKEFLTFLIDRMPVKLNVKGK